MNSLLADILSLFQQPAALRELGMIGVLLVTAALFARGVRGQIKGNAAASGMRQLAFPLLGVLLLSIMRFVAHHNAWPLHFVAVAVQLLWAMAGIRMAVFAVQHAFPKALWVRSFGRNIAALVWCGVALDLVGILPEMIAWLDGFVIPLGKSHITLWGVFQGVASVFGSLIVALWLGGVIEARLMQAGGLDSSVQVVLSRVAKALLILVSILVGVELVGLDLTALSVFSGALGVGLGLGMQKIASNYVSGFIILLDRSIKIGNLIQVGNERGEVLNITTRYTVLRALTGAHFIVPNEVLVGSVVQNDSFVDPKTRVAVQVQVAYGTDVERVLPILEEIGRKPERVRQEPAPQAYLVSFDESGMTLELGVWIADPGSGTLGLRSDLNRAVLQRFREEGIEIPFPQREVRVLNPA
ncbi:mechanosensitive ion channel family protein [Uliginosibacterium aquaticum]|uniref:Mechanosensitive ion channel n=1 Tax=Uliginosibacterium aquaticum TaxID=2731212 RepID=A0ABX2IFA1_9RHOO|nr:mechanosensitive ion channel domain-containing protein [Uliginosibacterium aquaticum]NSL55341.1 mechanosensitive ion channel [Uliginosibacterium aquaticum]